MGRYARELVERGTVTTPDYHELWRWSTTELAEFWRSVWDYFGILADGDTGRALLDDTMPGAQWFPDVRLNYAENMLRGDEDQTVLTAISQSREVITLTRGELRDQVARAAAGLRRLGVEPGDRVAAYLPNIPEALVAMLATTSIGAVWAVCAPELGSTASWTDCSSCPPRSSSPSTDISTAPSRLTVPSTSRPSGPHCPAWCTPSRFPTSAQAPTARLHGPSYWPNRPRRTICGYPSTSPCGCCSPPAPPVCPKPSCTPTAASPSSCRRPWGCIRISAPTTPTSSTAPPPG